MTGKLDVQRWRVVGFVLVAVGLLLVVSTAPSLRSEVVARETVTLEAGLQSVGPVDLAGGDYTIWLEDDPRWPESPVEVNAGLDWGDTNHWGDVREERRYRDIEGTSCFLVAILRDVDAGEWNVTLDPEAVAPGEPAEAAVFVMASPHPVVIGVIVWGLLVAVAGAVLLGYLGWSGKRGRWDGPGNV